MWQRRAHDAAAGQDIVTDNEIDAYHHETDVVRREDLADWGIAQRRLRAYGPIIKQIGVHQPNHRAHLHGRAPLLIRVLCDAIRTAGRRIWANSRATDAPAVARHGARGAHLEPLAGR